MCPQIPDSAIATEPTDTRAAQSVFRVGYAEVDITPEKPLPMWGYGLRHDLLSVGVRDHLMASCIVMQAGADKLAIVGLDLGRSLGEPHYSRILSRVRSDAGVNHVMICGTHTHHGPVLELRDIEQQGLGKFDDAIAYVPRLEQRIIEVIEAAASDLRDARMGWGSRDIDRNRNRHSKQAVAPRDTELTVIRLEEAGGRPLAFIVSYAAHPVLLHPADLRWSADYPGVMKRSVNAMLGAPCLFLQGATGDLNAELTRHALPADVDTDLRQLEVTQRERDLWSSMQRTGSGEGHAIGDAVEDFHRSERQMQAFGQQLAHEVVGIARGITTAVPSPACIAGKYERLAFSARVDFRDPRLVALYEAAFFPELAHSYAADHVDNVVRPAVTTVVINNELALVGGSGEFFCGHAIRLKHHMNDFQALLVGYCNGHNMYFPTREGVAEGGYGADPQYAWIEVGAGERMIEVAVAHIRAMCEDGAAGRCDENGVS